MKKLTRWLAVNAVLSLTGITAVQASTTPASMIVTETSVADHFATTQTEPSPLATASQIESAHALKLPCSRPVARTRIRIRGTCSVAELFFDHLQS